MSNAKPIAFLVDANGVPLRQGIVVDAATGAPTIVTINPADGSVVQTVVGSGGGGGTSTLAGATDVATYDLASNNSSVVAVKVTANAAIPATQKGAANGVASLDGATRLPAAQLPVSAATLNSTQQTQVGAGATAAVLNSAKNALKDPAGGADIALGGAGVPAAAAPLALAATAAVGTSTKYMREDAVFPLPSINAVGGLPQVSGNYNASTNTVLTGPYAGQNLVSGTLPTGTSTAPTCFDVTVPGTPGVDALGTLAAHDKVYYSSSLVWDVMGGAAQTTLPYKGDGTASGRLIPVLLGYDVNPGPLWQTGIWFGMMPSCTIASGGAVTITGGNTPPGYSAGGYGWYSANALYSGSLAGWYWTTMTGGNPNANATGITVYNNYLASTGSAAQQAGTTAGAVLANGMTAPASPTTSGITGGTHTQPTATTIYFPGPTLPAGYMGANGSAEAKYTIRNNTTANTKQFQSGQLWNASNPTTTACTVLTVTSVNMGVANVQTGTFSDFVGGGTLSYQAVNTAISQVLNPRFNMAAGGSGNDWQFCEFLRMMIVPRA